MPEVGSGQIVGKWAFKTGLASADYVTLSGTLDATAWDAAGYGTELPPFVTCVFDATSGLVVPFNNAVHASSEVYLTTENIYSLSNGRNQITALFDRVIVKYGFVTETTAVTWADVQRIIIRPQIV